MRRINVFVEIVQLAPPILVTLFASLLLSAIWGVAAGGTETAPLVVFAASACALSIVLLPLASSRSR